MGRAIETDRWRLFLNLDWSARCSQASDDERENTGNTEERWSSKTKNFIHGQGKSWDRTESRWDDRDARFAWSTLQVKLKAQCTNEQTGINLQERCLPNAPFFVLYQDSGTLGRGLWKVQIARHLWRITMTKSCLLAAWRHNAAP